MTLSVSSCGARAAAARAAVLLGQANRFECSAATIRLRYDVLPRAAPPHQRKRRKHNMVWSLTGVPLLAAGLAGHSCPRAARPSWTRPHNGGTIAYTSSGRTPQRRRLWQRRARRSRRGSRLTPSECGLRGWAPMITPRELLCQADAKSEMARLCRRWLRV